MANSVAVSMVSGDTATDNTFDGYLTAERVTLSTSPTGSDYTWGLSAPDGSARATLSSTTGATPTFTPDVGGYYVITCTVDGTTYILRITVTQVAETAVVDAHRFPPKTDNSVTAPSSGLAVYNSSTQGGLATKDPDGNVEPIAGGGATVFYLGSSVIDGTWRIRVNGADIVFERRESSTWVEKGAFTAT
jgi:hypothetical protein